jgi:hypothetical protein
MSLPREQSQSAGNAPPMDDAEQQMRRALGLYGDTPRARPESERSDAGQRTGGGGGGGFMQGVHRRRFVQDGEVPVTVVRRDAPDAAHPAGGQQGPTSSRLQRVEAALAAETVTREKAERALHEAQGMVQALQTKMGHNDLAKNEAIAASKRHLDEIVTMREELASAADRLHEVEARAHEAEEELRTIRVDLTEERRARKLAERLLREAAEEADLAAAREEAVIEHPHAPAPAAYVQPAQTSAAPQTSAAHAPARAERVPARRGRPPAVHPEPEEEGEPVKWWLLPSKPAAKRR